jgi:hypothetical protein
MRGWLHLSKQIEQTKFPQTQTHVHASPPLFVSGPRLKEKSATLPRARTATGAYAARPRILMTPRIRAESTNNYTQILCLHR